MDRERHPILARIVANLPFAAVGAVVAIIADVGKSPLRMAIGAGGAALIALTFCSIGDVLVARRRRRLAAMPPTPGEPPRSSDPA